MIYEIYHETKFDYATSVTFSHNIARLKPKSCYTQKLLEYSLDIDPKPYETNEFIDYSENTNNFMLTREGHTTLKVVAKSKAERIEENINEELEKLKNVSTTSGEAKEKLNEYYKDDVLSKLFLFETESIPVAPNEIINYALESFWDERNLYEVTNEFMQRIYDDSDFVSGFTDITTPIEVVFKEKKGVCQDFTQFAISVLRSIGIPTRYASGYIQTIPQRGKEKLFGADASHTWFFIYIPTYGWADFGPTNNKLPNEEHIILGCGRDYLDTAPLKGIIQSSGESNLKVKVNVKLP